MAESRRRSDVDKYLEAEATVVGLYTDGCDQRHALSELVADVAVLCDVLDDVDDGLRHGQTERHQADVDVDPDELFDAVRLECVPLAPTAVQRSSAMTSSRQTDDHDDAADGQRSDRQQLGDDQIERWPDLLLKEHALPQLILRECTGTLSRLAWCDGERHEIK